MNPPLEFLPCPFCGANAIKRIDPDCDRISQWVILHDNGCYFSSCKTPGVYPTAEWNKRSKLPPMDDHTSLTIWNALNAQITTRNKDEEELYSLLTKAFLERSR